MREMAFGILVVTMTLGAGCDDGDGGGGGEMDMAVPPDLAIPCAPKASCIAADKSCIGLVDNAGQMKYGLRMSQLTITSPTALTKGIISQTVASSVTPQVPSCNLMGAATFNWLLQFDLAAGTLKTGFAKPVSDPAKGYDFVDETLNLGGSSFHIQPVTVMSKPDASGNFSAPASTEPLFIPVYLDVAATQVLLLPVHDARFPMGTVSSNNNCIGKFNAAGLSPDNSCLADDMNPTFITGGSLDGFITLEEADTVTISALGQSMCVLLSGDSATYGDGAKPTAHCKRTNNVINFQGDMCSMAGQTCKDSVHLSGKFAASSIKINN
jgi:hypothetical protein